MSDQSQRAPQADRDRRLALGFDINQLAVEADVTVEQLQAHETALPGHDFDPEVAHRVDVALDRLESAHRERS